jgi:isocitrate dehydrogenase
MEFYAGEKSNDLERLMDGATRLSCSEFGQAIVAKT